MGLAPAPAPSGTMWWPPDLDVDCSPPPPQCDFGGGSQSGSGAQLLITPAMCSTNVPAEPDVTDRDFLEDSEFISDTSLAYIRRVLMEEDIDERVSLYQDEWASLRDTAQPFYDILGQKFPCPAPLEFRRVADGSSSRTVDGSSSFSCSSSGVVNQDEAGATPSDSPLQPSVSTSSTVTTADALDEGEEALITGIPIPEALIESLPEWHFTQAVEQGRDRRDASQVATLVNGHDDGDSGSRARKNSRVEQFDPSDGRNTKLSAVAPAEEPPLVDMFYMLMRDQTEKKATNLREIMQNAVSKSSEASQAKAPGSNGKAARGRKGTKKEVVDLRTLLLTCAQAVATDDRSTAQVLLKQIWPHCSQHGDGLQRLAYFFAYGLEARLAGTGSQIYRDLVAKRISASDMLKAYHLFLAASPFKRLSHFFANRTILNLTRNARRVHIIDFGIYFGFQWPCLIQRLSGREMVLRITGIDVPQPGFRPSERTEETGRRLAEFAKKHGVAFEYQGIAHKWETIRVEDLNLRDDEVLIVNCLYRFRNLIDETVAVQSPRNRVLKTIRQMNPAVFIHGVVNGSYSVPFFVTRFREALFHYGALFDMLEATVPCDDDQRLLIERDMFGREALNVIACEGSERVERPEPYKQWQLRNLRAGFTQLPLDKEIREKVNQKVKTIYHKDFVVDEDCGWLLQGWKGRILYALSTWKPGDLNTR